MQSPVSLLQQQLNYQFRDQMILLEALTHCSFSADNNERLEFLGDSVLGAVVSDLLFEKFNRDAEGNLSKMRAALVNRKTLAKIAQTLELGKYLRLGMSEVKSGGANKPSILSNALEAVVGAIYLDSGYSETFYVLRSLLAPYLTGDIGNDYKTRLQELTQGLYKVTPTYDIVRVEGKRPSKTFQVKVSMKRSGSLHTLGFAQGSSIKEAEQNAAKLAIDTLTSKSNKYSKTH